MFVIRIFVDFPALDYQVQNMERLLVKYIKYFYCTLYSQSEIIYILGK